MHRIGIAIGVVASLFLVNDLAQSQDVPTKKSIAFHCPVVGMPEAKSSCCPGSAYYCSFRPQAKITVEYKGATVQLCCNKCIKLFQDTPGKFAVTANHQLAATNQAKQVNCPLTGKTINPKLSADVAGVQVFFATEEGQQKIASATPLVRVNLVFGEQAFARGFVVTPAKK